MPRVHLTVFVLPLLAVLAEPDVLAVQTDEPSSLTGHLRCAADLGELCDVQAGWADGVLTLSATSAKFFGRAVIPAPRHGWDVARRSTVDAELTNIGEHPLGAMAWVVGDHGWEAVLESGVIAPGETRTFSCNLRATFPDGTPRLNPHDVKCVEIMLAEPVTPTGNARAPAHLSPRITKPIALRLRALAAHGEAPAWHRPQGRIDVPAVEEGAAKPGKRVRHRLAGDEKTGISCILNLPEDWEAGTKYPVIVEYPGNIFFGPACFSSGLPDQCVIGYGITKGKGAICLSLPFIDRTTGTIAVNGWGNADDTADYAVRMVTEVCEKFGGDRDNVILTGFSRGALACGYIGLRNDRIAALWKGFHACQHYDGDGWNGATLEGALERAARFKGQAVFQTDNPREKFQPVMDVMNTKVAWADSGLRFHSTAMFLDDRPSTQQLRDWFWQLVGRTDHAR